MFMKYVLAIALISPALISSQDIPNLNTPELEKLVNRFVDKSDTISWKCFMLSLISEMKKHNTDPIILATIEELKSETEAATVAELLDGFKEFFPKTLQQSGLSLSDLKSLITHRMNQINDCHEHDEL